MHVFTRARAILLVVMIATASSAWAQSPLSDLSLEDLMKLDAGQVSGASERLQPAIEAPASISFITADEIALYGYRTLADILRGDVNQGTVRARGLELEAQMRLKGESKVLVSYALQTAIDQATHAELPNSPRHMAKARISLPGPTPRSHVSIEAQYLSSRGTLSGSKVSAAAPVNVTMIQPLGPNWELFGGLRNIFDDQYADPASSQHQQDAIPQNGRTAQVGLRWILLAR